MNLPPVIIPKNAKLPPLKEETMEDRVEVISPQKEKEEMTPEYKEVDIMDLERQLDMEEGKENNAAASKESDEDYPEKNQLTDHSNYDVESNRIEYSSKNLKKKICESEDAVKPLQPQYTSSEQGNIEANMPTLFIVPNTEDGKKKEILFDDWMTSHLGRDCSDASEKTRLDKLEFVLPNMIEELHQNKENPEARRRLKKLERYLAETDHPSFKETENNFKEDVEKEPKNKKTEFEMSSHDLNLIRHYNLPVPAKGVYVAPPRNRSKRERLRYLSDLYDSRKVNEREELAFSKHGKIGRIILKINLILVALLVLMCIAVTYKSYTTENDVQNKMYMKSIESSNLRKINV